MRRALDFEPRSTALAAGRSLVALAELSVIAFTPDTDFFRGAPLHPRCDGLSAVSLWCVGSGPTWLATSRAASIVVLMAAASGYRPRWTCVPHWYVTFSLGLASYATNGGEQAAGLLTLLLIPLCLGDRRTWQWQRPETALEPVWRGAGYAGHLAIRAQVLLIYGDATIAKLREAEWRNGTAMHYVFQNPYFGAPPEFANWLESGPLGGRTIQVITWTVLVTEAFIAVSAIGGRTVRRWALVAGIALHAGTVVALGLISFALAMIGVLAVASSGGFVPSGRTSASRAGGVREPP